MRFRLVHFGVVVCALVTLVKAVDDDDNGGGDPDSGNIAAHDESGLRQFLLRHYDRQTRPKSPVVSIRILPTCSLKNYPRLGTITTTMTLQMVWCDDRLVWDPSTWSGIDALRIFASRVNVPDIAVENAISVGYVSKPNVVVDSEGSVTWTPQITAVTPCIGHVCIIRLLSLTYDVDQLRFRFFKGCKIGADDSEYQRDCPTTISDIRARIFTYGGEEDDDHDGDDDGENHGDDDGGYAHDNDDDNNHGGYDDDGENHGHNHGDGYGDNNGDEDGYGHGSSDDDADGDGDDAGTSQYIELKFCLSEHEPDSDETETYTV